MSDQQYGFERLDVYRVSYEALKLILKYRAKLRGLPGEISSQLQRAAVSTVSLTAVPALVRDRISQAPNIGATVSPTVFIACTRLSREWEVSAGPITAT